mmetsp:Transcript_36198/g.66460  ORF Transcript_36198/g.66460 Transcript_36198/m.66460 type:complete len:95 (-) Transcript_36198:248-532(-)
MLVALLVPWLAKALFGCLVILPGGWPYWERISDFYPENASDIETKKEMQKSCKLLVNDKYSLVRSITNNSILCTADRNAKIIGAYHLYASTTLR